MKTLRTVLGVSMLGFGVVCLIGGIYCLTRKSGQSQPEDEKQEKEAKS